MLKKAWPITSDPAISTIDLVSMSQNIGNAHNPKSTAPTR
jgi:hypothetical protein